VTLLYLDVKILDHTSLCGCILVRMVVRPGLQKPHANDVFSALWNAYRAVLAKADESMKNLGLGESDFRVLEALLHGGPLPVNVIGEKVKLTTGSITTAVDRMEARWLVARKNHPEDRRIRLVELTAKGRRLIERAYSQHSIDMEKAISVLSREERGILVELLGRLAKGNERATIQPIRAARQA
jgi:MarR family transcriptional regulator, 2-MHQ and catechol-resistance regulon repressor